MEKINWYQPTPEQSANRQAWREYCSLENLSHQRVVYDRMNCTACGKECRVADLSDAGFCDECRGNVVFKK